MLQDLKMTCQLGHASGSWRGYFARFLRKHVRIHLTQNQGMHGAPFYEVFIPAAFNYCFADLASYLKVECGSRSVKYSAGSYTKGSLYSWP
jgi:hypothetical protein